MQLKITYYLEVISSWCYWAQPVWEELQARFAGRAEFHWKIALMDADALPKSVAQTEWFYRRSGTIMRSSFMLNPGWFEAGRTEYLAPNAVAEAARDLGVTDDRVRLAIAHAAVREGRKVGRWEEAVAAATSAVPLDARALEDRARSAEIAERLKASTAEFHALQVTQRPTFVLENSIGDRAVFSGLAVAAPLIATLQAMQEDVTAYTSHAAHHGTPPPA